MEDEIYLEYPDTERKDRDTELVVNLGLFLSKMSGNTSIGAEYMKLLEVPETVIERVLLHPELRREVPVTKIDLSDAVK